MGPGPDSYWLGSEAWYEGNLRTMLKCVDLSRDLAETAAGEILMQLKVTALASTRLCVRDRWAGVEEGMVACKIIDTPLTFLANSPFQKELTSWIKRPGASTELSPERLAEAMDSGKVKTSGWGREIVWWRNVKGSKSLKRGLVGMEVGY